MPREKRNTPRVATKYQFQGYEAVDGWVQPHVQCEETGNHRVAPKTWPPPRTAQSTADPSLNMQCELCGSWLIVYEAHATGGMQGIDVVVPERKKPVTV